MEPDGSRIGIIFNGSPLTTGDTGSGESEIRKMVIENDLLETIISLPEKLFFNTPLQTYIWILNNKKIKTRKGKIQLIDGSSFFEVRKKSLGKKRNDISLKNTNSILDLYRNFTK